MATTESKLTLAVSSTGTDAEIEADSHLDPAIQFPHPVSPYALSPRNVFMTGATGLLGAYLLDELFRRTEATVWCLVRASDSESARDRLVAHLKSYGLWQESFAGRIRAVAGDVEQHRLGITESEFHELSETIDVIYHSAGRLNMAYPYQRLKATNVTGTEEILRLAAAQVTKPVHFLSSMVVFFSEAHTGVSLLKESDTPLYHPTLKGGYSKTKWVADRLVADAQARGLPACIYRPVRILGHSRTGVINDLSDVLPLLLKGCLLLGKYPSWEIKVTMVPVDVISGLMIDLAGKESSWGRAFHFFHPAPIEWRPLMNIFSALGYELEEISYEQWWRELKQRIQDTAEPTDQRSFLSTVMLALTAPHFLFFKRPPLDASNTLSALEQAGIEYPPIDRALIETYVNYWQTSGFLPVPASKSW